MKETYGFGARCAPRVVCISNYIIKSQYMKGEFMRYWNKAWSLVNQCSWVSDACTNCWLRSMDKRFGKAWIGHITPNEKNLKIPMKIKKPTTFAIWSDLFHESIDADFIKSVFDKIQSCQRHTFLVLTKRPERLYHVLYGQEGNYYLEGDRDYVENVWLGTTIEDQGKAEERIPELLKCGQFKLFLSIEPMLSKIDLRLTDEYFVNKIFDTSQHPIQQVIVGCESGADARETDMGWVRDLRDQCKAAGVPLFIKQLQIDGKFTSDISKFPEDLRIRELMWGKL